MHAQLITLFKLPRLLGLSGFAAALLAASGGAQADDTHAPTFTADTCCNLCPQALDAKNYTTRYQQNFTTLVQAQGDWLFRTQEDLRTEFDTTPQGYRRMKELHDAFKSKGVELVVVYQPTRGLVDRNKLFPAERDKFDYEKALKNYQAMLGRFSAMGYWVPDLSPLTNEQQAHDFYFRGDQHWTPYGAQRTAKIVAETVKKVPEFAGIPRREFESHLSGRMGKTGTLHNMAGQLCGTSYAIQYMDQFVTEPKGEAADGDLFGDAGNPEITLVGTSHSGKNYNFSGFLEEYIGADILNVAFPGGGLEGSMLQYLGSDDFQKKPPKILIWEFSPLYRLDQETIYRQMMSMLGNGCEGKTAIMTTSTTLKTGANELLVNGTNGIKDVRNGSNQVDIKFADTSVKDLHARLWYMNGRHEDLKIEKPTTSDTDGRFAFELRDDKDWADQQLLAVEVQGPQAGAAPQQVEAKICKRNVFPGRVQSTAQAGL
ncbi:MULTISPECIES: alginate O-acetyltransferase [unclassified Pseudomonas]|uniref:alginate O-acetyltransferase n=1 Tax=unclassified Pseudomonas TaxID=196821 RepID=UPI002AC955B6|nr:MULTISPECIES: alginate O-acetyltransferase [unclassified Pseudomonas]MEB0042913.1 alginate O-acetyltransferase [Pseudomonas sp. MH10]MEB0121632.1 alginate O-acetyltransferase [Pseudomonas sp. CCI1.2]WPX66221.1 alginate O-acetyltransferase [Pseudomonas sp. MH10]